MLEANRIDHAKTLLEIPSHEISRLGEDMHFCEMCNVQFSDSEVNTIEKLYEMVSTTISRELQLTMVYIAGMARFITTCY